MYQLISMRNGRFQVLDTDDGVVDDCKPNEIRAYLSRGVKINGLSMDKDGVISYNLTLPVPVLVSLYRKLCANQNVPVDFVETVGGHVYLDGIQLKKRTYSELVQIKKKVRG